MKHFLDENFLLQSETARQLYFDYAVSMPIIDYHNHLPANDIAADKSFENITQVWLNGDHYKWRAMRTNGVSEALITGDKPDTEKFYAWAATVPYTLRNPLYHWTHLELQRYFNIHEILNEQTAEKIYHNTSAQLQTPDFTVRRLLERMNVQVICTTDDPVDTLNDHQTIKADGWNVKVFPAFRPDKAMQAEDEAMFNEYLDRLEQAANISIGDFDDFLDALKSRHDFFAANGCSVSDHGLEQLYAEEYTHQQIAAIFAKLRSVKKLTAEEIAQFKSAMLVILAEWDHEKNWVQQFHLGALRNNNRRKMFELGADTGFDSIGDFQQGRALTKFLNRLDEKDKLAKTILYNLNPADNDLFASMIGNFNDGSIAGKIQWGSGWWFMDQKEGMTNQLNALSNMGLISRFVGMLTDSRSFLSFPRHEYFRRLLCNLFATDIENGELPNDKAWIGKVIQDICFNNAKNYFNWKDV